MAYKFYTCEKCASRFTVKEFNKSYIGRYKGKPVFHHNYDCVECGHIHTIRFFNEYVNPYYDEAMSKFVSLIRTRKDDEKYGQLLIEYEIAEAELEKVNNVVEVTLKYG
jgi:hypothetical protein